MPQWSCCHGSAPLPLCGDVAVCFLHGPCTWLYLGLGGVLSFLLCAGVFFPHMGRFHRIRRVAGYILAAILAAACLVGSLALWRAVHTVRQISDTEVERSTVAFYVEQDSTYDSLEELEGNELGILAELDRSSTMRHYSKQNRNTG